MNKKIVVVGGGPAGLMAAGQASMQGAETLLLEKMKRTGLKLGITGKGRCNITNSANVDEFIGHFGRKGLFLRQAFARFFNTDLIEFFHDIGIDVVTERGGRVFPSSGKATEVQTHLFNWTKQVNVKIRQSSPVKELLVKDGHIAGVLSKGKKLQCAAVILATGGASYPATGSTGDGYSLVKSLGHTIVPVRPALVPLETGGNVAQRLSGLKLKNVKTKVLVHKKKKLEEFGELVFTDFGVTGPTILTLSSDVVDYLREGKEVILSIDCKPALDEKQLEARLLRDIAALGKKQIKSLLLGLLPKKMVPLFLEKVKIPSQQNVGTISQKERKKIVRNLKGFQIEVRGHRSFTEAIITAGGVDTREVDPRTMESKLITGLYFAGELLDIQADTGGYNLQAAFSTGWLAGRNAAK